MFVPTQVLALTFSLAPNFPLCQFIRVKSRSESFISQKILNYASLTPFTGAFLWDALYGVILYGVYEMTNYAMLDKLPLRLTCIDIGWGCLICGVVGQIAAFIHRSLL